MPPAASPASPPRALAFILARGGSKGVPRKNIRPLNGRPLIDYVIQSAKASKVFEDVWVSTEDAEIAAVATNVCGAKVFDRDPATATDTAKCEVAVKQFIDAHPGYDIYCMIQATQPLILPEHFIEGYNLLSKGSHDTLLTGTISHAFHWSNGTIIHPQNYDYNNRPNRQEWSGGFVENGGFYMFTAEHFARTSCRLGGRVGGVKMPKQSSVEIDEMSDWYIMEILAARYAYNTLDASRVKLVCFDVDGVLTDCTATYGKEGEMYKTFNHRDGHGIFLLKEAGYSVAFVSKSDSPMISMRAKALKINTCSVGVMDKGAEVERIAKELGLTLDQVAYMGDDVIDMPALRIVGLPGCPSDAHEKVRVVCKWMSKHPGGKGAAREFCDVILEHRKPETPVA